MFRTVLEQRIRERRQTFEEFVEYAEGVAREHKELRLGSLSVRHLQRLASGRGPKGAPLGPLLPATARLLEHIFSVSIDELLASPDGQLPPRIATHAAPGEPRVDVAFDWLSDTSQRKLTARLADVDTRDLRDRHIRRANVRRSELAYALSDYYVAGIPNAGQYRAWCGDHKVVTSIVTRDDWHDLACPLTPDNARFTLADEPSGERASVQVDGDEAFQRLAEVAAADVRLTSAPIYRLLGIDVRRGAIAGTVGLASFTDYALTMDLLESELVDAVIGDNDIQPGRLPLRDRYLPDLASVFDVSSRLCAGGVLALCAIARPADPFRGAADYALLVQERSAHVLNGARRLAVIPKAFHQPLTDARADVHVAATLRREIEAELFGRSELDHTSGENRIAAPMHPSRLSEPMRWLVEAPERLRMECTGFGLNLVSGNYEFASLIVIDDEEFWKRFGGHIEANWEAAGLRVYSSLDASLINDLVSDESWSNEGLFAFLQGLRRLAELGGPRLNLPSVIPDGCS